MGFRDSFIEGYLLAPVGPRRKTFAQQSLENTVDSGLRANQQQVQALSEVLSSTLQAGISRLEQCQMQGSRLLQRELQYQAANVVAAINGGTGDLITAMQNACDYLGGQLCEIRWAIERQNKVSQQILQALLNTLDNTSRQYWEQGLKCYETAEYDIAKERFIRALDADRTNYFAYQYLGMIAALHDELPKEAIRNFDLARKFAESGYYRGLALSHLARSHNAVGDLPQAIQSLVAATKAAPDHAHFWYELAVYHVRVFSTEEAIRCLRQAISRDWMYWSISGSDATLDPVRDRVNQLFHEMREEQRAIARQQLDKLAAVMKRLRAMQITTEVLEWNKLLEQFEASYQLGTVFAYRNLVQPARDGEKKALQAAIRVIAERIRANRLELTETLAQQRQEIDKAWNRISSHEYEASRRENSRSRGPSNSGFELKVAVAIGGFGCFAFALTGSAGTGMWFLFGVIVLSFLWNPLIWFLNARVPAEHIRSEIPELKREYERIKADSETWLREKKSTLDGKLELLNEQNNECQAVLKTL
jgi:tetratricopeptide (TPR) repeat protein